MACMIRPAWQLCSRTSLKVACPVGAQCIRAARDYNDYGSVERIGPHSSSNDIFAGRSMSRGGGVNRGFGRTDGTSSVGMNLQRQRWDLKEMVAIKKNFYSEHPEVAALSEQQVKDVLQELDAKIEGGRPHPKPVRSFDHIGLPGDLLRTVLAAGFPGVSPIQSIGWPTALSGRDMVAVAQTGSGKTLGFLLPAFVHISAQPPLGPRDGPISLVLAPTRELAMQIQAEAAKFSRGSKIRTVAVFGGASRHEQVSQLRRGAEIVVATPGRLLDLLESKETSLKRVSYLVLDEADRMLDMGFEPQIRKVVSQIRPDRQTLLWSATWPYSIRRMAKDFCREDPVKVTIGSEELSTNPRVTQQIEVVDDRKKRQMFMNFVRQVAIGSERVLVFCHTKRGCDSLAHDLQKQQFKAEAIHGGKDQLQRDRILASFKSGRRNILIATDVAQRGLDVKELNYVVNYDIPNTFEDYIHRIGRTARAGATGTALTFFPDSRAPDVVRLGQAICKAMLEVGQQPPDALTALGGRFGR